MTEDPQLISYLLLLRYGAVSGFDSAVPILNYASISKLVKKPLQTVRRLIILGLEAHKKNSKIE
jgi:hypothetical protein